MEPVSVLLVRVLSWLTTRPSLETHGLGEVSSRPEDSVLEASGLPHSAVLVIRRRTNVRPSSPM